MKVESHIRMKVKLQIKMKTKLQIKMKVGLQRKIQIKKLYVFTGTSTPTNTYSFLI